MASSGRPGWLQGLLLALALAAGIVDAATYLGLGHVFTANMTGNTVLLGIAVVKGDGAQAARSATALGGFSVGVAMGIALLRSDAAWPSRAVYVLGLESVLLTALLAFWSALGAHGHRLLLVGISGWPWASSPPPFAHPTSAASTPRT